jgi:hypothetical protein
MQIQFQGHHEDLLQGHIHNFLMNVSQTLVLGCPEESVTLGKQFVSLNGPEIYAGGSVSSW